MNPSPNNALTFVYLDEPVWNEHERQVVIAIRSKHDGQLIAEEKHRFQFRAFELALETARRLEASIDNRPALSPEVAS